MLCKQIFCWAGQRVVESVSLYYCRNTRKTNVTFEARLLILLRNTSHCSCQDMDMSPSVTISSTCNTANLEKPGPD